MKKPDEYSNASCRDLNGLLSSGVGRCGTFSALFFEVLMAQGITKAKEFGVDAPKNTKHLNDSVNDFISKYGLTEFSKIARVRNIFFVKKWNLDLVNRFDSVDESGEKAQGNDDPLSVFGDHALVEIDTKIYDPSYGTGPFDNITKWEDASIDGFGVQLFEAYPSTKYYVWAGALDIKGTLEVVK